MLDSFIELAFQRVLFSYSNFSQKLEIDTGSLVKSLQSLKFTLRLILIFMLLLPLVYNYYVLIRGICREYQTLAAFACRREM